MCILADELERAKTKIIMANINYEKGRLLDVVNENDESVDLKSRTLVHLLGLLHREVHVWMFDKNKNIFFQKRGIHRPTAGKLDATVGGHVNSNESYLEAAVREAKEETGISVSSEDLIFLIKLKSITTPLLDDSLGTNNNFFRSVYIYKHPIKEKKLKKEAGVPGGGFEKLSYGKLSNPNEKPTVAFSKYILTQELPLVLKYISESTLK
ncbi:MAG: NUDIX domain-containing protein [Candidatus Paceibacterota bacterium]